MIYIIDSSDRDRLGESKEAFGKPVNLIQLGPSDENSSSKTTIKLSEVKFQKHLLTVTFCLSRLVSKYLEVTERRNTV